MISSLQEKCEFRHARDLNLVLRATPLLRVKVKFTVKNAVCMSLRVTAYGEFDRDFGFDSQEWGCSNHAYVLRSA